LQTEKRGALMINIELWNGTKIKYDLETMKAYIIGNPEKTIPIREDKYGRYWIRVGQEYIKLGYKTNLQ
jgi:hypothetical protein